MTAVASLGMYDGPGARAANDRLWGAIAGRLRDAGLAGVPAALDRDRPLAAIWDDPALLLAQTCGYPLVTRWRGRLRVVATPRYRAAGCEGPCHRARIVVHRDAAGETLADWRGRRLAVNDLASNTGMNLLRATIAPIAEDGRFFGAVVETGSHAASAAAIAAGDADIAAIDAVSFAAIVRDAPYVAAALRTVAWTAPAPALPFVTAVATPAATVTALRRAIRGAIADEARDAADVLLLDGIEAVPPRRYDALLTLERRAARAGYPRLA